MNTDATRSAENEIQDAFDAQLALERCVPRQHAIDSAHLNQEPRRAARRVSRRMAKALAVSQLGGKCFSCNGVFDSAVFDFHHKDPATKLFTIAAALASTRRYSSQEVADELAKCVLLCANCHRSEHYGEIK